MSVDRFHHNVLPRLILLCSLVGCLALGAGPAAADTSVSPSSTSVERVIVEFVDEGASLSSATLAQRQREVSEAIIEQVAGAEVDRGFSMLLTGLSVRVPHASPEILARLSALPQVKRVYREYMYAPALFESVTTINADGLWPAISGGQAEAGRGVRIAVIDSGIAANHPSLHDGGYPVQLPAGFPRGDTNSTSSKVIAARAYFRPTDPPCATETSPTPGENGSPHGTAMAGIAAGSVVQAMYDGVALYDFSGVAPAAYLMNYRVFYPTEPGGGEYAYTTEILAALEDALTDGADVILNAWTTVATTAPADSAVAQALERAMEVGCVVIAPAGNSGPGVGSASLLPGGIGHVLTVGAVRKARIAVGDTLDVVGPEPVPDELTGIRFGRASYGSAIETLEGSQAAAVVQDGASGVASTVCEPISSTELFDVIAVAERGECAFITKTLNVQNTGATGLLLIDSQVDPDDLGCWGDNCSLATIPSVMIGSLDGAALAERLVGKPTTTIAFVPETRIVAGRAGAVWSQSGHGPAFMRTFKPDVVAPGVDVLAPIYPSSTGESMGLVSGTSAAAAHMAGAAALLLHQHPTWGHDEVKGALVGSSRTDELDSSDVNTVGAGLPDVVLAAETPILAETSTLSVPVLASGSQATIEVALKDVRDAGQASATYQVASSSSSDLRIEHPGAITISAGQTATLQVDVTALPGAESGSAQGTIYCTRGDVRMDIPLWVNIQPAPAPADVLVIDNDFSEFWGYRHYASWVTETLDALDVSYAIINPDLIYDEQNSITMTVESLLGYEAIIWLTGDNQFPDGYYIPETPLTVADQQLLATYLDGGGRILAMGQNLCSASDVNDDPDPTWGRAPLYHGYLGAHWVKDELYGAGQYPPSSGAAVVGAPDTFLSGAHLNLGQYGDGAGNQTSIDEIGPGGSRGGEDASLTRAVLVAVDGSPDENGYVGVAKSGEPTLDEPNAPIAYRSLYYAFGFEGINNVDTMTSREELLGLSLDWLMDEVTVSMDPVTDSVNVLTEIACQAASSHADGTMSYRWRVGEGDEAWETTSSEPSISAMFYHTGTIPVSVQVTDALGHQAVADGTVDIVEGGNCALYVNAAGALPSEMLVYEIELRNTSPYSVEASFEMMQPAWTAYVGSIGGAWSGGALSWSGTLGPESVQALQLTVQVVAGAPVGTMIEGTGSFVVGSRAFDLTATTRIGPLVMLPMVTKP